jgi:hypothetical protein
MVVGRMVSTIFVFIQKSSVFGVSICQQTTAARLGWHSALSEWRS